MSSEAPPRADGLSLGSRVVHKDGSTGTVRYVGTVAGAESDSAFVGVEWDDLQRGTCDGEKFGERYFQAAGPTAASFVKPRTLQPKLSLRQAVVDKYDPEPEPGADGEGEEEEVEDCFVMAGNQRPLANLRAVTLHGSRVGSVGALEDLGMRRLTDLDLSGNLLHEWDQLCGILQGLPTLRLLNVTGNRMHPGSLSGAASARGLRTLILNRTGAQWADVMALMAGLPGVTELGLDDNGLTTVDPAFEAPGLAVLRLQDNAIGGWGELAPLAALPALSTLVLSGNPLGGVTYAGEGFAGLRSLYMSRTGLTSWADLDALALLPALRDLRLQELPELLGGLDERTARLLIIGRMPGLSAGGRGRQTIGAETCGLLNRSAIDERERIDGEKLLVWFHETGPGAEGHDPAQDARFTALREKFEARENRAIGVTPLAAFAGACRGPRDVNCPCPQCRASRRDFEALDTSSSVLYDRLGRDRS